MKTNNLFYLALGFLFSTQSLLAAEPKFNLPLVFDPQAKKYFIGGGSKLLLKPNQQSSFVDRIEVSIDNEEYRPYSQNIEFKTEGKHTLKFRALNPVNNWSPVQFVEVFVDLTSPITEVKFSEEWNYKDAGNLYLGPKSTISLSSQDSLSGVATVEYSYDGDSFVPYTKPLAFEKPGKQTLYYRSIDRVGNIEPTKKFEFISDVTPPVTDLKLSGKPTVIQGKSFVSDTTEFSFASNDDFSKIKQTWVTINGKPQLYLKPLFFLEEGSHTISYHSVDGVGNTEKVKTFSFYTVSTPPRTTPVPIGKSVNMGGIIYANQNFQLKFDAKENAVGLDHIEVKVDKESNYRFYLEPLRFPSGFHTITFRAVDRVGNIEPAKSYAVHIIDSVPETKINTAQPLVIRDGLTYTPAPNVVTFNVASGTGVGVDETLVSINDGPFAPYRGPINIQSNMSIYKISYKSIDKLGNEEQLKTATLHLIRSLPIVDLFITNGKSAEEQVRTQYLEQPAMIADVPATNSNLRQPASNKRPKKQKGN